MAVIAAFRDGWTALRDNPSLLAAGFVYAVASRLVTVSELTESIAIDVAAPLGWFLLFPFVLAGLIGMAVAALRETASFDQFLRAGRTYYLRMLGATLLLAVLVLGFVMVVSFAGFVAGAGAVGLASLSGEAAFWVGVGFVGAAVVLTALLLLFLQFYDAAIVVDDQGAVGALRRSAGLVRRNLANVIVFSICWSVIMNAAVFPELLTGASVNDVTLLERLGVGVDPAVAQLIAVPLTVAIGTVAFAYLYTVHTAYYLRLLPERDETTEPATA